MRFSYAGESSEEAPVGMHAVGVSRAGAGPDRMILSTLLLMRMATSLKIHGF